MKSFAAIALLALTSSSTLANKVLDASPDSSDMPEYSSYYESVYDTSSDYDAYFDAYDMEGEEDEPGTFLQGVKVGKGQRNFGGDVSRQCRRCIENCRNSGGNHCNRCNPVCGQQQNQPTTIPGFKYIGKGYCQNWQGKVYSYETLNGRSAKSSPGQCAQACERISSSTKIFAGINYYPAVEWSGAGGNCNCMFDEQSGRLGRKGKNGEITRSNNVNEELCYSYNNYGKANVDNNTGNNASTAVRGFTYVGKGQCKNWRGNTYSYQHLNGQPKTAEVCASACKRQAAPANQVFAGINYYGGSRNYPTLCNCLYDRRVFHGGVRNGKISSSSGSNDELCYSYNNHGAAKVAADAVSSRTKSS